MKLSISNIAWPSEMDGVIYKRMKEYGYEGLEIAPTRIWPECPYDRLAEAKVWAGVLWEQFGFCVPSMQSIWFGVQERLFESSQERAFLKEHTKKAIDFAAAIHCGNLVFGCPRNRQIPPGLSKEEVEKTAVAFFREIGDYAYSQGTAIGMEANPPIYHTNYINGTAEALELIESVASEGFKLNLDVGTMIENGESADLLRGKGKWIRHVHISEPHLAPIQCRPLHDSLAALLREEGYSGYVSIEMGKQEDESTIEKALLYVKEVFA